MLPVAFAPPLWAMTLRTLRELTRVAVTALVLVVGLNGLAAASASADALRPSETSRPVAGPRATAAPTLGTGTMPILPIASAATSTSAAEVRLAAPDGPATAGQSRPAPIAPVFGPPPRHVEHVVALPPAGAAAVPPADPGRESIARRGPPRA